MLISNPNGNIWKNGPFNVASNDSHYPDVCDEEDSQPPDCAELGIRSSQSGQVLKTSQRASFSSEPNSTRDDYTYSGTEWT